MIPWTPLRGTSFVVGVGMVPLNCSQTRQPFLCLLRAEMASEPDADEGIVVDVVYGQVAVGAVPDVGENLMVARPRFEALLVPRSVAVDPGRLRTAFRVAPDGGESRGGFI